MGAELPYSWQSDPGSSTDRPGGMRPRAPGVVGLLETASRHRTSKRSGSGNDGTHLAVFRVRPHGELVNGEMAV
jgi:hypothetical protein